MHAGRIGPNEQYYDSKVLLVGPIQQHYGSHILAWNQTLYVGSQYICAYRLVWATAKSQATSYKIN